MVCLSKIQVGYLLEKNGNRAKKNKLYSLLRTYKKNGLDSVLFIDIFHGLIDINIKK